MIENQKIRPDKVIGPLGEPLTLDSLPPPSTTRWVVRRKAEVVAAVNGGLLTVDEARAQAVARARARAELYAKAAGLRVARILAISEGGPSFAPPVPVAYAMARSEAKAETILRPGESEVSATVSVRFLLQ